MDLASPILLIVCVLAAISMTAWVAYRAGRAMEVPRPTHEDVLDMLSSLHARLDRLERKVEFMPKDFAEEANAARKLIDARMHEALELLARRAEQDDRPWAQRSRAAGA